MINIGLIGCGSWSKTIIEEINKNKKYKLTSIVCRKKRNHIRNYIIFDNIKKMINSNINDCIYVAANPYVNLEILKLVVSRKIPLILEKPLSDSVSNVKKIEEICKNNNIIIYPNITNYFSETFDELERQININHSNINRIIIYEGNFGPFRENLNPVWDWGFHSLSLLYMLFKNDKFTKVKKKEIKANNTYGKGIVSKFSFYINNKIEVKIITGNLFKKKLRRIKIILKNREAIVADLIEHDIYNNKENIKFTEKKTPIANLLDNFEKDIRLHEYSNSRKMVKASRRTIEFLENFYKN